MALSLEPSQLIQFFTAMSPLLLAFLLVAVSLFNQDAKGLVYLGGVLVGSFAWLSMLFLIKSPTREDRADSCNMINWPFGITAFNNPNYSSYFIAFTILLAASDKSDAEIIFNPELSKISLPSL